jgi:hypothetical protein
MTTDREDNNSSSEEKGIISPGCGHTPLQKAAAVQVAVARHAVRAWARSVGVSADFLPGLIAASREASA